MIWATRITRVRASVAEGMRIEGGYLQAEAGVNRYVRTFNESIVPHAYLAKDSRHNMASCFTTLTLLPKIYSVRYAQEVDSIEKPLQADPVVLWFKARRLARLPSSHS